MCGGFICPNDVALAVTGLAAAAPGIYWLKNRFKKKPKQDLAKANWDTLYPVVKESSRQIVAEVLGPDKK